VQQKKRDMMMPFSSRSSTRHFHDIMEKANQMFEQDCKLLEDIALVSEPHSRSGSMSGGHRKVFSSGDDAKPAVPFSDSQANHRYSSVK